MRLIDPCLDVVFKMLLLSDERLLRSMIESVLDLDAPLAEVHVLNPEIPARASSEHGVVLDVRVRLATGEEVDLEMATRGDGALAPRVLYYWARHFSGQLRRGDEYRKLVPLRFILWTKRSVVPTAAVFHERFRVVGERTGALFAPHLEVHVLDLARLAQPGGGEARARRWGRFFVLDGDADATLLAQEDAMMRLAVEKLRELSDDPDKRRIADDRERDLLAHGHFVASAREEGIAIGEERGIAIGEERGIAIGEERGIAIGEERGIAIGEERATLEAIEAMVEVLGVELSSARLAELSRAPLAELRARLHSLRARRAWV